MIIDDHSAAISRGCEGAPEGEGIVDRRSACTRCSNVARHVDEALRALETGQIERVRELLEGLALPVVDDGGEG
ncbi:hypothetical protein [Polyangium aurulentum]|uniref:hypothetical protein n=1 Tax=Polyangium aurulentum TaxID=2567896 RepID=UPI0010AEA17D|nr:hypothetical protein [Polyangium aurulentum]UQA63206.1 hypothetical protein E8A73_023175 [Polyangium aurulentum]